MNPFSLEGKRILITGASSGIGRQIAISCAAMGATCVISGRDSERLAATFAEIGDGAHVSTVADLLVSEQRIALVDNAGLVDGVIHCAGTASLSPMRLATEKHLRELMLVNYEAPTLLTQRLLAKKSIAKGGSILFIASIAAHVGFVANGAYSASKGALVSMSRCLALEVAKQGIRVNCISPSFVESPMLDSMGLRESIEQKAATHPLGIGSAKDVAAAAIFLTADSSHWITGQALIMDGGHSMS